MANPDSDTIAAIATATGRSGIGIIRISGSRAVSIAAAIAGSCPESRYVQHADFTGQDDEIIDQGLVIYFQAPNSFTGEDVVELHGHGGPIVMNTLMQRILGLGARLARPGEFTERAFLNDKLDLLQAEAIADLIDASSRQAARLAIRTLKGEFSSQIHQLVAQLVAVRVNVEAAIDFSDEDIDVLADSKAITKLEQVKSSISQTLATAEQGAMLMHGIHLVLAGAPNAGKSSLLNALSGQDSAIVTDIPGTTRDLLSHHILIGDLPVHITDTAGLRDSADIVEREGVRRALQAIDEADMVLLMVDQSNLESGSEDPTRLLGNNNQSAEYLQTLLAKTVVIANKIDLLGDQPELDSIELQGIALPRIFLSAKTGAGLDLLKTHLQQAAGLQESSQSVFVARERHLVALRAALALVGSALDLLQKGEALELCAEDLRLAQQRLGEITGEFTSDDLLGEIFSQFCVGK